LDGTRSYLVGSRSIAVIDPGPDVENHVRALSLRLAKADEAAILLTHGHADHAAAAQQLSATTGAEVWGPEGVEGVDHVLRDGDVVETDAGPLVACHTPGHTIEHLAFHWPAKDALFAGDHLLGRGDTTWVAEYPGCVADYLGALEKVRSLGVSVIYPTHGPPLTEPDEALDRFEDHRRTRIRQVEQAMSAHPDAEIEELLDLVYGGTVPTALRGAARMSLGALVEYVREGHG
jgi:glyoxylase-like metal-dependent hydrolase (beta-lactamase superfamily II)